MAAHWERMAGAGRQPAGCVAQIVMAAPLDFAGPVAALHIDPPAALDVAVQFTVSVARPVARDRPTACRMADPLTPPEPATAAAAAAAATAYAPLDVPVCWCDLRGRWLGANPAFADWFGTTAPAEGAVALADALQLAPADAAALQAGLGLAPARRRVRRGNGGAQPARLTVRRSGLLQLATLLPTPDSAGGVTAAATAQTTQAAAAPPSTALTPAEALLAMAQRLGKLGVWERDLQTGAGHWDPQMWALFEHAPQPQSPDINAAIALMHPADREAVRQAYERSALQLGAYSCSYRVPRADGGLRYARTVWEVLPDAQGRPKWARGIVVDETEASLLVRRLEMTTSAAGVGVWSAAVGAADGVHWDHQMRVLHARDDDAPPPVLAAYLAQHVHPDDRSTVAQSMATLMQRNEGLLDLDFRIVLPAGTVRRLATRTSVESGAAGRHLHGVMFDVTERHATERRLREASERAALAARGAGIGTWESAPDGQLGWWDEQMFRLRGRPPRHEPVPRDEMLSWAHPDDREGNRRNLDAALAAGGPSNNEFRVVWPDGTVRWLASRSTPVHDEQGRTVRRIGINWDITDARNAATALQDKLLAQRESQAKSRFLARMSHELRTPLHAVLGFAQLLLADGPASEPATWLRRVQQVQASGEHLLALIDDVLALSSVESGELPVRLQALALAPLVQTTLALLEPQARDQGVQLQQAVPEALTLQADPLRLRQVLLNLLSNAIKYNRAGGQVLVSAREHPASDGQGRRVRIDVRDSGHGMAPAQLAHLFEPFNRLGREHGDIAGHGIGLAIVRAAVQQMHGTVAATSTLGQGSVFSVDLAASTPPAPVPAVLASAAATAAPQGADAATTVLYIEDNEVNLLIVRELVQRRGDLRFMAAADGRSGVAQARAHRPALVLLDMQLPDIDGHEVLRQLRADPATAGIRVVALSANAMPADIRRALDAGCADYWTKPLDLRAFMAALDALFGPAPSRPVLPA